MRTLAVVLLIHGGGWLYGSPADVAPIAHELRADSMAVKNVDYRLDVPTHGLADVRRVMRRQLRRHRLVYVVGHSAGATLALRLAQTGKPAGVIALAPVTDMTAWHVPPWLVAEQPRAAAIEDALTPWQRARLDPSSHSCRRMSPTLIVQGDADSVVSPLATTERYARRCRARLAETADDHVSVMVAPIWRRWLRKRVDLSAVKGSGHRLPARVAAP